MTADRYTRSLAELLRHANKIANACPSLEALYTLEDSIVYSDFWRLAHKEILEHISERETQAAWRAELLREPPDRRLWVVYHRRDGVTSASLRDAELQWLAQDPERILDGWNHDRGGLEGAAAVHIALLADLDPLAAVEYVAAMPGEYFIWSGARHVELSKKVELIDRILRESRSRDALLLCLGCMIEQQDADLGQMSRGSWQINQEGTTALDLDRLKDRSRRCIADRHRQIATALAQRDDAGAILGPWIRFLIRLADQPIRFASDPERSRIAQIALEQTLSATSTMQTLELERAAISSATCVAARALANTQVSGAEWNEWKSLLGQEDNSLRLCASISWQAAAEALLRTEDPHDVWLQTARELQSILRRRTRVHSSEVNPLVHLIMPGMFASARLAGAGIALWSSVFELARRQFLIDLPNEADVEYGLCSDVFFALPGVSRDNEFIEHVLALLPTAAHVSWARARLTNVPTQIDSGQDG